MEAEPETKVIHAESSSASLSDAGLDAPAVGKSVGRYELVRRLGHGGMATVYLGRTTGRAGFERLVAVKVIHSHLAAEPEFVEMFLDEARIAARIHHPHVVQIHDLGQSEGFFFMVMEYVEGETLASVLRQLREREELMPLAAVLRVVADTCEGLLAAHELTYPDGRPMHLVHRDVSPHNLLVGMDGRVKVVDFGIAKATGRHSNTRTGQLRGKLAYMSPEQASGQPIDHRTDLFALGIVMWELLTNQRLFNAQTEAETLAAVRAGQIPAIQTIRPDLRPEICTLIHRTLAIDPNDRFPTAQAMLRDVRSLLRRLDSDIDPREALAAVMKQLFAQRIDYIRAAVRRASESDVMAQVVPPLAAASQPGDPAYRAHEESGSNHRSPQHTTGSLPEVTMTSSLTNLPRHWSQWLLLPMLGAAGAAVIMALYWPPESNPIPPSSTFEPHRPAISVPRASSPAPPETETVQWYFQVNPPHSTIHLDGKRVPELSPTMVQIPRGEQTIEVTISKDGFLEQVQHLAPLASGNQIFRLERAPDPNEALLKPPKTRKKKNPRPGPSVNRTVPEPPTTPEPTPAQTPSHRRGLAPSPFEEPK